MVRATVSSGGFAALLFLSGFAALMYQVVWTRMLLSTFGASVYASGTVLTAFMGGLALGSWRAGRLADRPRVHPLAIYGYLELGIGLFALLFPLLLQGITTAHIAAFQSFSGSFTVFSLLRFGLAVTALLVPTTLMGATLPFVTRYGVSSLGHLGKQLGWLYALNTAGAAAGTFLTGYVFIESMGIRSTTHLAVALNVVVGVGALYLARRSRAGSEPTPEPEKGGSVRKKPRSARGPTAEGFPGRVVLWVVGLSGFAALAYEVLWARVLVYVLGNFVHSFSIMLSTFLVGIALGSRALGKLADRVKSPARLLFAFQAAIGAFTLALLPLFPPLVGWRDAFLDTLTQTGTVEHYRDPWVAFTAWKVAVTFLLLIGPTFFMGATFPLAIKLYVTDRKRLGRGVGDVYAANTVGAILGAFCASFVLVPWIGLRSAALVAAGVNWIAAAIVLFGGVPGHRRSQTWGWVTILALGLVIAMLAIPPTVFHPVFESAEKGKKLVYVDEAVSGTVTIHETPAGFRVIDINGLNVAGTKFGFNCTQKLQAHFPLLFHPEPRRILQIGFGTGGTCFSVTTHPEVELVDCVEINPGVIRAAPFFLDRNQDVLNDPRVRVTIEDARNFVLATDLTYDVILSDSIHPRFTGNGLLYTEDYYSLCAEILNDRGIVSTWLPTAFLGDEEFRTIIRSMKTALPHVVVWYMNNTVEGYTIVMGSRTPFSVSIDRLEERLGHPTVRDDLAVVNLENVWDLLDCVILCGDAIDPYVGEGLRNTEDRPIIEFRAPRNMSRIYTEYRNLERIIQYRNFPDAVVQWGQDPALARTRRQTLERYYEATGKVLLAHQYHLFGQLEVEVGLLEQAGQINPDDRDVPFLLDRSRRLLRGEKLDW